LFSREGWKWSSLLFCHVEQNNKSGNGQPDPCGHAQKRSKRLGFWD
jgi:hypothetical protein